MMVSLNRHELFVFPQKQIWVNESVSWLDINRIFII